MNKKYFLISLFLILSNSNSAISGKLVPSSEDERLQYLKEASSWIDDIHPIAIRIDGPLQPKGKQVFSYNQMIECSFSEPVIDDIPNGKTPKFWCIDKNGNKLKIKYENLETKELNDGIFGEILSTRLFWMLGFPADSIYPVQINCLNCPEKPWNYIRGFFAKSKQDRGEHISDRDKNYIQDLSKPRMQNLILNTAVIEIKYPYDTIEIKDNQGWSWREFKSILTKDNPYRIQHEALALLSSFIQHADNKPEQQRLICADNDRKKNAKCKQPVIMIQDLGFSFGHGYIDGQRETGTASLKGFINAPIWSDEQQCITKINYYKWTGEEISIQISEDGRIFLLNLLNRLTDDDIVSLFIPARFYLKPETINISGIERPVTIIDWVKAFKERIDKISSHKCPRDISSEFQ